MASLRYARVIARGQYEPEFEILLDNQVYKGQAGYDVITPLHINGSSVRILVNRGWVAAGENRNILPVIDTPKGEIEVAGIAQDPYGKFFELSKPADIKQGEWQIVWQNLDMKRYANAVNFTLQPVMILLDAASTSGGFVRVWPKPELGIEVNRGYAIQWYLMSITLIIIYLVTNFKKINP